jgi:hypothetical protein
MSIGTILLITLIIIAGLAAVHSTGLVTMEGAAWVS